MKVALLLFAALAACAVGASAADEKHLWPYPHVHYPWNPHPWTWPFPARARTVYELAQVLKPLNFASFAAAIDACDASVIRILKTPGLKVTAFFPDDLGMQVWLTVNGLTLPQLLADRAKVNNFVRLHVIPNSFLPVGQITPVPETYMSWAKPLGQKGMVTVYQGDVAGVVRVKSAGNPVDSSVFHPFNMFAARSVVHTLNYPLTP